MFNSFGNIFRLTSFGESHGKGIGGVIDGFPAGIDIDMVSGSMKSSYRKNSTVVVPDNRLSLPRVKKRTRWNSYRVSLKENRPVAPSALSYGTKTSIPTITTIWKMYIARHMRTILIR